MTTTSYLRGALLALSLTILAATARCGPARGALLSAAGSPSAEGCDAGTYRCNGAVPEACSRSGRWWPALPRDATGRQTVCLDGCAVGDGGVAQCAPAADGGAR